MSDAPLTSQWFANIGAVILEIALMLAYFANPYSKTHDKSTLTIISDASAYTDHVCSSGGELDGTAFPLFCPISEWITATFPYSSAISLPGFIFASISLALSLARPSGRRLKHIIPVTTAVAPLLGFAMLGGSFWTLTQIAGYDFLPVTGSYDLSSWYVPVYGDYVSLNTIFLAGGFGFTFIGMVAHLIAFSECATAKCGVHYPLLGWFAGNVAVSTAMFTATAIVTGLSYYGYLDTEYTKYAINGASFTFMQIIILWLFETGVEADHMRNKKFKKLLA